jgi:hypothetical protein
MPKCQEQHSAPLPGLDRSSAPFPARVLPDERRKLTKGQIMKDTPKQKNKIRMSNFKYGLFKIKSCAGLSPVAHLPHARKALPGFFVCIARAPKPYALYRNP